MTDSNSRKSRSGVRSLGFSLLVLGVDDLDQLLHSTLLSSSETINFIENQAVRLLLREH